LTEYSVFGWINNSHYQSQIYRPAAIMALCAGNFGSGTREFEQPFGLHFQDSLAVFVCLPAPVYKKIILILLTHFDSIA